jgi:hypothetical protein
LVNTCPSVVVQAASTPSELLERAYRLRNDTDDLVLDGPNDAQLTRAVAAMSGLCLVPVLPVADCDAFCSPTISVLKQARMLRRFGCTPSPSRKASSAVEYHDEAVRDAVSKLIEEVSTLVSFTRSRRQS